MMTIDRKELIIDLSAHRLIFQHSVVSTISANEQVNIFYARECEKPQLYICYRFRINITGQEEGVFDLTLGLLLLSEQSNTNSAEEEKEAKGSADQA